jgi:anti-anti-sigma factor
MSRSASGPLRDPGPLAIRARRVGSVCVVALRGVLDVTTCSLLADALEWALEQTSRQTVLDLSELESIDYAGVHTILTAHLRSADRLEEFLMIPGPEAVQSVLDRVNGPFEYATAAFLSLLLTTAG